MQKVAARLPLSGVMVTDDDKIHAMYFSHIQISVEPPLALNERFALLQVT
jgi:hypothetical protein